MVAAAPLPPTISNPGPYWCAKICTCRGIAVGSSPSSWNLSLSRDAGAELGDWTHRRNATDGDHVQIKGKNLDKATNWFGYELVSPGKNRGFSNKNVETISIVNKNTVSISHPKNSLAKAGLVADLYAFMVETTGAENLSAEGWGVVAPPAMKRRGIFGFVGFDLVMQGRGGVGQ